MRTPSRQQARWLSNLPLTDRDVRGMNGNHDRTLKSLIDAGWAVWSGVEGWATLSITAAGLLALERYKAKAKRKK